MDTARLGRCLCGAVRFRIDGAVRDPCYCHCESCRRATGAVCVAWGSVDATQFVITRGEISVVRSSPQVERGFCARCGATLTYQHASRSAEIDFTLVSLEDPESIAPASHIWVQDKLPWLTIDDDLPQHATTARS